MKNLKNPARIRAEPEISKTLSTRQGFVLTSNPHRPNIPRFSLTLPKKKKQLSACQRPVFSLIPILHPENRRISVAISLNTQTPPKEILK